LNCFTGMTNCINKKGWLTIVLWCLAFSFALGAKVHPEEEYQKMLELYPDEAAVYLLKKQTINYNWDGEKVNTTVTVYQEIIYLQDNAIRYAADRVFTQSLSKVTDIKAYTMLPAKRKYEKLEVSEYKESFDKDNSVFFDDSKEITFTYPSVQKGAKTVLEYTKTISDPRLIGMFYFNSYIPVHKSVLEVKHSENIVIAPRFYRAEALEIDQQKSEEKDDVRVLSFQANEIEKLFFENRGLSYQQMATAAYCPIEYYTDENSTRHDVISTPAALHSWYRTFVKDILENSAEMTEFARTLVNEDDPTLKKVEKVYDWVQTNIQYIAFEDGMRGFIPHDGMQVVEKRYGDCKDMASTLVSLLRALDIEAYYTWVGTRAIPYTYKKTPAPITDNHMIATFVHNDSTYFLDATGQYYAMNLPTSMIQGKECLISLNDSTFLIKKVPVIPKEQSVMTDSVFVTLKSGNLEGNGHVSLTGYAKVFNSYQLVKSSEKSVEKYLKRLLTKGSNKFQFGDYEVAHIDNRKKPIKIDYDFSIPDYHKEIGDNVYINLILDKTMTDALLTDRKTALENDYKYINRNVVTFTIPEGYTVQTIPDDSMNQSEMFGYSIRYIAEGSKIVVTKEFYEDYLVLEPEKFDEWNAIISEYANASRNAIILKKIEN
jgi:hypothetical protein